VNKTKNALVALCAGVVAAVTVVGMVVGHGEDLTPVAGTEVLSVTTAATTPGSTTTTPPVVTVSEEVPPEPPPSPSPIPAPDPVQPPSPPPSVSLDGVAPAVHRGVVVHDLHSGEELFAEQPDEPFPTASVVKLLIALDALDRGAAPARDVARMIATSDDDIANRLWRPSIPRRWAEEIGLPGLSPPADPNQWGDTRMTARDVVAVYRHVLHSPHAGVIVPALEGATPTGADGFDQTFGIPDAVGAHQWGVKQGWACCYDGLRVLNTTGVVDGRYVVAVLTGHDSATGYPRAAALVTDLVAALTPLFAGH
jgi:hypothetical protein